jgi:hypothetical protein
VSISQRRWSISPLQMEAPCSPSPQEEVANKLQRTSILKLSNKTCITYSTPAKTDVATKPYIRMSVRRKVNKRSLTPSRSTSMKSKLQQVRYPTTIQKSQALVSKKESRQRTVLANRIGLQPRSHSQTRQWLTQNPSQHTLQPREWSRHTTNC